MDQKTIDTLEFPKVLEKLAVYAAFSASAELARSLKPSAKLADAHLRQARTSEARRLLSIQSEISVGGVTDIRPQVDLAAHGGVLEPTDLLAIKNTLAAGRDLARSFERHSTQFPELTQIAASFPPPAGLVDAIGRAISERGEILDHASIRLSAIRREVKVAHDRLIARLERLVNDSKITPMLQEPIITQRGGRYVIPLRSDFKGRLRSIVHDQSSSGATLFVEPLVVVDLNNQWHGLQLEERDEERRILTELSAQVGRFAEDIRQIVAALAEMDLALMCAKYADDLRAAEPVLVPFQPARENHPGSTIRLYEARHPLLDPQTVVPIDVDLDENTFALVITGPNTGGKTVTLKTVGLLVMMAQSGMHIPAQSGSTLSIFEDIYADIGDEQSIEQSLSTFSAHITNIVRTLKAVNSHCLVLFDELGAGTDPQEGAALARAILMHLVQYKIPNLVATHYPELKAYAHAAPGVVNASMEFNLKTLRPTYHLTIGLPGRSNALLIAERLGLDREIIHSARSTINPEDLHTDNLLDEIHRQRDVSRRARDKAELERQEAEKIRRELVARLEKVEDERLAILDKARTQAENEIASLQQELEDVRRALAKARQPLDELKPVQEKIEAAEEAAESIAERKAPAQEITRPIRVGDRVRLLSLKMEGIVKSVGDDEVEIQAGPLHLRAHLEDLQRSSEPQESQTAAPTGKAGKRTISSAALSQPSPGVELDIRGQMTEDALPTLEQYIESAYLAGMPFVRIIHGKGTGRLRKAVRELLQHSPHVSRWENGLENEGGEGATVVHLKGE